MTRSTSLVLALAMAALVAPMPAWAEEERARELREHLGKSELEIRRQLGRPAEARERVWIYRRSAGTRGLASEIVIRFRRGRVFEAFEREVAIGCRIVAPAE